MPTSTYSAIYCQQISPRIIVASKALKPIIVILLLAFIILPELAQAQIHARYGSTGKLSRRNSRLVDRWGRPKTPQPGYNYPGMPPYRFDPFTPFWARKLRGWGAYGEGFGFSGYHPDLGLRRPHYYDPGLRYRGGIRSDLRGNVFDGWSGYFGNDANTLVDDRRWRPYWRRPGGAPCSPW